jgi:hypothetical protein
MEQDPKKMRRLAFWAVLLLTVGGVAAWFLPEHALGFYFELLKDVLTFLAV